MINISSTILVERCEGKCELCSDTNGLSDYIVPPKTGISPDEIVIACQSCLDQLNSGNYDSSHWRCLNESMWSNVPAVQVLSYRMLSKLSHENWAADLHATMYIDDALIEWATYDDAGSVHKDSNGHVLQKGDSVILIKDLDVKGANFSAKRGTVVKNIHLVEDNAGQIEGKVNDQQIVILTQFVRKA